MESFCDHFYTFYKFTTFYWTHGFRRKSPINSASSVRPIVRPFVRNADISGSARQKFLIFCTKLEQHNCRKVTFSDFRKNFLTPVGGVKRSNLAQNWTFQILLPNCAPEFFDFLHEVRQ